MPDNLRRQVVSKSVKDLMIKSSNCAQVSEDRTLYDAVVMLAATRQRSSSLDYRPRVVLVYDKQYRIVGSLRHADVLRAIVSVNGPMAERSHTGTAFFERVEACREALTGVFETARNISVKDAMYMYSENEFIDEGTSLEEAICRLMAGPYLNLVVMSESTTTGILRLSDVFSMICDDLKKSGMR
jgi:predicted transcriptional regulator